MSVGNNSIDVRDVVFGAYHNIEIGNCLKYVLGMYYDMPSIGFSSPVLTLLVAVGILYVLYQFVTVFSAETGTEQAAIITNHLEQNG